MSFDNDYPNRKDRRRQYYKSKAFDRACRNGGDCPYCQGNRTHRNKRHEPIVTREEREEYICMNIEKHGTG